MVLTVKTHTKHKYFCVLKKVANLEHDTEQVIT